MRQAAKEGEVDMKTGAMCCCSALSAVLIFVFLSVTGCSPESTAVPGAVIKTALKAGCTGCAIRRIPREGEAEREDLEGESLEGEVVEGEAEGETEGEAYSDLTPVPAGTFQMGRPYEDVSNRDELPVHDVSLDGYWIAMFEVTNREFADVLNWAHEEGLLKNEAGTTYTGGTVFAYGLPIVETRDSSPNAQLAYSSGQFSIQNRTGHAGQTYSMAEHPVVMVSWYGAAAYCNWLSEIHGLLPGYDTSDWTLLKPARNGYRLPTEAEWEYAAAWDGEKHWRYGTSSDVMDLTQANYIPSVNPLGLSAVPFTAPAGWYNGIHPAQVHIPEVITVKGLSPAGLYDASGNVLEWCHDWYQDDYYAESPTQNPTGPAEGQFRSARGGSWNNDNPGCRTARRYRFLPESRESNLGFRILRAQ